MSHESAVQGIYVEREPGRERQSNNSSENFGPTLLGLNSPMQPTLSRARQDDHAHIISSMRYQYCIGVAK